MIHIVCETIHPWGFIVIVKYANYAAPAWTDLYNYRQCRYLSICLRMATGVGRGAAEAELVGLLYDDLLGAARGGG